MCNYWSVGVDDLIESKQGQLNEPRNVAVYLTRKLRHDSLQEISAQFQMNTYSSVSSIVERMKARIEADKKIKKRIVELCNIIKSQEQACPLSFRKLKKFAYQSEWRLVCYNGSVGPRKIRIGDIRDISVILRSDQINKEIKIETEPSQCT